MYEIKVPEIGESISEATVGKWLKPDGAFVQSGDLVCEIESEKAALELETGVSGRLLHKTAEGETVAIGSVIAEIDTSVKAEDVSETPAESISPPPVNTVVAGDRVPPKVTPVAQRVAEQEGVDISRIQGSGPRGKVMKRDVLSGLNEKLAPDPKPAREGDRPVRRERMSSIRRTISKHLVAAKNETAMLTTFNEIDMSRIIGIRKKEKDRFQERYGVKLGFMGFFVKAVCSALKNCPAINAMIEGEEIVYHDYCDIAIAVSTPRGLVTPVIRNAETLAIHEIEKSIVSMAERARENRIGIDELRGGTFTITNGGVFGSLLSTPIINYPQSAILGMHTIQERPVVRDGEVVIRPMMYVALSYDHRIIDGREAVTFLVEMKQTLEEGLSLSW